MTYLSMKVTCVIRTILIVLLQLTFLSALAQNNVQLNGSDNKSTVPLQKGDTRSMSPMQGGGFSSGMRGDRNSMIGKTLDMPAVPDGYGKYSDSRMDEVDRRLQERQWENDETAWKLACELGTADAYRRYINTYPGGAHRAEANKILIDMEVDKVFNSKHGTLPGMQRVSDSDDAPSSTVVVENATDYPLTVMYSGPDSKSMQIGPGGRGTIVLANGHYRIAASVPAAHVRPYAGEQTFAGGRYEVGYCIVTGGMR